MYVHLSQLHLPVQPFLFERQPTNFSPCPEYHTPSPCYLRISDDILHIAAAPSWIYLTPILGYLRIPRVQPFVLERETIYFTPDPEYHTPSPCYLRNSDDVLHIAAAPSWIYLTPLLGYLRIPRVQPFVLERQTIYFTPDSVHYKSSPCYLRNSDDILQIAAAPSWIFLTPLLG